MSGGFMIKRIIFDIDGTLITGVNLSSHVTKALKKYGIEDLEKTKEKYGLADSDQEFLDTSKDLPNKFDALKDDASYEDKAILNGKDTKEKTHFRFNKDDLYR